MVFSLQYAGCPGGEGADLKSVGCKRLAGSNPVPCAKAKYCLKNVDCKLNRRKIYYEDFSEIYVPYLGNRYDV